MMALLIFLGSAGWAEAQQDGSFRMSIRGPMSKEDGARLGRWLLEQTSTATS